MRAFRRATPANTWEALKLPRRRAFSSRLPIWRALTFGGPREARCRNLQSACPTGQPTLKEMSMCLKAWFLFLSVRSLLPTARPTLAHRSYDVSSLKMASLTKPDSQTKQRLSAPPRDAFPGRTPPLPGGGAPGDGHRGAGPGGRRLSRPGARAPPRPGGWRRWPRRGAPGFLRRSSFPGAGEIARRPPGRPRETRLAPLLGSPDRSENVRYSLKNKR